MVALTVIRQNDLIRHVYEHRLAKGKCKMFAIGVCMHKILRILYGMHLHQNPFDPKIDLRNRQREVARAANRSTNKKHRFQSFDPQAPVSCIQAKKRLERKQPQCVENTVCGVIAPVPESIS